MKEKKEEEEGLCVSDIFRRNPLSIKMQMKPAFCQNNGWLITPPGETWDGGELFKWGSELFFQRKLRGFW